MCADGFYGDPLKNLPCQACQCNGNIDRNAVGNCNRTTGECLKCIYNTKGLNCQSCKPGHYGNPLSPNQSDKCQPCNCFVPGTISDPGTIPQCDITTGQCPCQPHVKGKQCNVCQEGYWNINSWTGCETCSCDYTGSRNRSCDIHSGSCHCRPGVTGRTCNECQQHHYGFSEEGCGACSCNGEGSTSLQCNEGGQCPCRPNVEGLFCDRCRENMFNISAGCQSCPACYGLVQDKVGTHRKTLAELHVLLKQATGEDFSLNDTDFESILAAVKMQVGDLYENSLKIIDTEGPSVNDIARLKNLKTEVAALTAKTQNIVLTNDAAETQTNSSSNKITEASMLVEKVKDLIDNITILMDSEGNETVEIAEQELSKFSAESEEMVRMAKDARALATRIVDEGSAIVSDAETARNASREAYELLQEAFQHSGRTSEELSRLRDEFAELDSVLKERKRDAEGKFVHCGKMYEDAQHVNHQVMRSSVPYIDQELVQQKAAAIIESARKEEDLSKRHIEQQQQLLAIVDKSVGEGEKLLNETKAQQQIIDELLADADRHKTAALEAATTAKDIVDEAQNTLKTLRNFDEEVENNRGDANAAVKLFPEVERLIKEAENKTKETKNGEMVKAEQEVSRSLEMLEEALKQTHEAANDTDKFADLSSKAVTVAMTAEHLHKQVIGNDTALKELEKSTDESILKANEALEVAEAVMPDLNDRRRKTEDLMQMLERLLKEVEGLDVEVNQTVLQGVSTRLDRAEKDIEDAGLSAKLAQIDAGAKQQEAWILEYSNQADELEKEVRNVEEIQRALPKKPECYKVPGIESESDTALIRRGARARRGRRRH